MENTFQIRLKELREAAGYKSQQAFADAFGVAQSTVGNWEAGKRAPNHETTLRLAQFLGVTVDELLGNEGAKKEPAEGRPIEDMDDSELLVALLGGESLELTEDMIREIKHHARYVIAREREKETQNEAKDS